MAHSFTHPLSLHPFPLSEIPSPSSSPENFKSFISAAVYQGLAIINDSTNWTQGKTFHPNVPEEAVETKSRKGHMFSFSLSVSHPMRALSKTLSRKSTAVSLNGINEKSPSVRSIKVDEEYDPHSKYGWHLRRSIHREFTYDEFKNALLKDHTENEKEYIKALSGIKKVETVEDGLAEVWHLSYSLPFPTTNRDFVELLILKELDQSFLHPPSSDSEEKEERCFLILSLPVTTDKVPDQKKHVRGKYVSVEQVREISTPSGTCIEWRMATSSTPGGSIPPQISEMAMPGTIAEDVPMFINWLRKRTGKKSKKSAKV